MTRTGKIARLPHNLRHRLNLRILDGEPGVHLITLLAGIPAAARAHQTLSLTAASESTHLEEA